MAVILPQLEEIGSTITGFVIACLDTAVEELRHALLAKPSMTTCFPMLPFLCTPPQPRRERRPIPLTALTPSSFHYLTSIWTTTWTSSRSASTDKVYYAADAIEAFSRRVEGWLARYRTTPNREPLQLRRYFITTVSKLREHTRENHTYLGDSLLDLMMHLETAQFVWIIEYCSVVQWQAGHVAARAIVDATASPTDEVPIWLLHDEEVAFVFDRTSAEMTATAIELNRTGPLPRIELNLRPVLKSPTYTNTSGGAAEPGGDE